MAATEVRLARAVVDELNDDARNWSQAFTATRRWLPVYSDPAALAGLKVDVTPMTLASEKLGRANNQFEFNVAICIQRMVEMDGTEDAQVDALSRLAEQVHRFYLDWHSLDSQPGWKVMNAEREAVYDVELLYSQHTWQTLIVLTVRGYDLQDSATHSLAFDLRENSEYAYLLLEEWLM